MTKENGRHRMAVRKSDSDRDMMNAFVTVRSCLCLMMTVRTAKLPRLERRKMERRTRAWAATKMPFRTVFASAALSTNGVGVSWLPWTLNEVRFSLVDTVASGVVVTRLVNE